MHPITLRFTDPALESRLPPSKFQASLKIYVAIMGGHVVLHILLPWVFPTCAPVSATFMPLCMIALICRLRVADWEDQERAHDWISYIWFCFVCGGFTVHRLLIGLGVQEPIGQLELVLYMLSIALEIFVMHVQHFDFSYRTTMLAVILLQTSTPGWPTGWLINVGHSLSRNGQPHDTVAVAMTIIFASFIGHSVEAMLRLAFVEHVSSSQQPGEEVIAKDARKRQYEVAVRGR
jgi:hypothetical protein